MVKCVFCGKDENPHKGVHYVLNIGTVNYYCSNKCKPTYNHLSHRQRSITNLKNTLLDDCIHFFPRDKHKCTKETMIFTCRECKGVLEFFKDPYDIEKPEQDCPGSIIVG